MLNIGWTATVAVMLSGAGGADIAANEENCIICTLNANDACKNNHVR
ncbi:hypothetical protein [Bacillus aerolatus]|nr:hypothetical protein [Bacillus aerolatus]